MTSLARQHFFNNQVKLDVWKNQMCGKNEDAVISVLESLGYKCGVDFERQHPIGERFVIDIAFVKEQIAIEVDGKSHNNEKQKKKDRKRDSFLRSNNWIPIRIKDEELFGYRGSFIKNIIKLVVEERREQWTNGLLFEIELPNYKDEDYE